jgi:hypothetical protein
VADYLNWFNFRTAVPHAAEKWQGALLVVKLAGGHSEFSVLLHVRLALPHRARTLVEACPSISMAAQKKIPFARKRRNSMLVILCVQPAHKFSITGG